MKVTPCGSCKAPIIWCRSESTGKMAPIDAVPVVAGNIVIFPGTGTPTYRIVQGDPGDEMLGADRHTNHFMTCPEAAKYRKPKREK
jgi:hypothetical protein